MDIMGIVNAMQPNTISRVAVNAADFPNGGTGTAFMGVFVQLFEGASLPTEATVTAYESTYTNAVLATTLLTALAAHRYSVQTGGCQILLTINGVTGNYLFLTDQTSQFNLTAAFIAASANSGYTVNWKMADGSFLALTAAQIISAWEQGGAFVQKCYNSEAALVASVENYSTISAITAAFDMAMAA